MDRVEGNWTFSHCHPPLPIADASGRPEPVEVQPHGEASAVASYSADMTDTSVAEQLVEVLGGIRRRLGKDVGGPWPDAPLPHAQAELVRLVRRNPGLTVAGAAERLGLAPNTVSTLVTKLTEADVLVREVDSADRRAVRLRLSGKALRRVERWRDRRAGYLDDVLQRLPQRERDRIATAMPALIHLLELMEEQA